LDLRTGRAALFRDLAGWDGSPALLLRVDVEVPFIRQFFQSTSRDLALFAGVSAVVLSWLWLFLTHAVSRPLRLVSESLQQGTAAPVSPLKGDRTEFGQLTHLLEVFFHQQAAIMSEMAERKKAEAALRNGEEALKKKNQELAAQNAIMMDREGRILELKREVNALCEQAGVSPRYHLAP
jgi:hypothetical protein